MILGNMLVAKHYMFEEGSIMIIRQTTKDILASSIIELAKTKSVDTIRVREITQNCGLTPTTFYRHFQDKYQLLAWIYNQKLEALFSETSGIVTWNQLLMACCTPLQDNRAFYMNVLKNTAGQTSFRYKITEYAITLLMNGLKKHNGGKALPEDVQFYLKFYMRAMSETVTDWFLEGEKIPLEEFTALLDVAMPEPLKPYLKQNSSQ